MPGGGLGGCASLVTVACEFVSENSNDLMFVHTGTPARPKNIFFTAKNNTKYNFIT